MRLSRKLSFAINQRRTRHKYSPTGTPPRRRAPPANARVLFDHFICVLISANVGVISASPLPGQWFLGKSTPQTSPVHCNNQSDKPWLLQAAGLPQSSPTSPEALEVIIDAAGSMQDRCKRGRSRPPGLCEAYLSPRGPDGIVACAGLVSASIWDCRVSRLENSDVEEMYIWKSKDPQ